MAHSKSSSAFKQIIVIRQRLAHSHDHEIVHDDPQSPPILPLPFRSAQRSTAKTCSTISSTRKFRFQPSSPLAQNLHPYAQPTCVETQMYADHSLRHRAPDLPESTRSRSLIDHSSARETFESCPANPVCEQVQANRSSKVSASCCRKAFGKLVIASHAVTRRA